MEVAEVALVAAEEWIWQPQTVQRLASRLEAIANRLEAGGHPYLVGGHS